MTLHELEQACAQATKGPWDMLNGWQLCHHDSDTVRLIDIENWNADTHFICLSRDAVPKLLAFVKAWDGVEAAKYEYTTDAEMGHLLAKLEAARKEL